MSTYTFIQINMHAGTTSSFTKILTDADKSEMAVLADYFVIN